MNRIFVVELFSRNADLEEYSKIITATFLLSGSIRVENKLILVDNNRNVCIYIDGSKMRRYGADMHTSRGWLKKILSEKNAGYLGAKVSKPESCLKMLRWDDSVILITCGEDCKPLQELAVLGEKRYKNIIVFIDPVRPGISGIPICIDNSLDHWEKIIVLNISLDNILPQ